MNHLRFSASRLLLQIKQGKSWGTLGSSESSTGQLERILSAGSASPPAAPTGSPVYSAISTRRRLMGKFLLGGPGFIFQNFFPSLEHRIL